MARDRNRWKSVCAPTTPNGTNKRLDEVQRKFDCTLMSMNVHKPDIAKGPTEYCQTTRWL
jgi:hypothetical protein